LAELLRHITQVWTFNRAKEKKMTRSKIWTGVCLAFLLVATLMSGMAVAQDDKAKDQKVQDAKVFEGLLMDLDQNAKVLTLKAGDKEMKFSYTEQTELIAPAQQDGKPPAVTQGTKMRVHYTERENTNVATKVEIIEATAAR
jgi:hypothetical protein